MELPVNQPFNLDTTLNSGQVFHWDLDPDDGGWYTGVIQGNLVRIRQTSEAVEFQCSPTSEADMAPLLEEYFRLDTDDIEAIYADITRNDEKLAQIVERYRGMRLLRQDPWECLVSFICGANNNLENTQLCVEKISGAFGAKVSLNGCQRHTFPMPKDLAGAGEEKLQELKLGLKRPHNIHKAAEAVLDGRLDLETLKSMAYPDVTKALWKQPGIGSKIANCIALFSLEKLEAFPVDRWVELALIQLYFPGQGMPSAPKLREWAWGHYGPYAGYANQYLFYWSWLWDAETEDDFATDR